MANNIIFSILAETKNAAKSIQDFQKDTSRSLSAIEGSFNLLKTVAAGAVAVFAGREIVQGIKATIDAASEKEQVLQSLNTALALTGDYSVGASKDIQAFADSIQKTTKFDGDAILSQVALAKQFGVSNEEAKKLVKAAADLSVATGVTLDTAVESLGKTLQGTTGTLGKTIPGLKNLSQEALKSGAAIDLIAKRFGGAAESSLQTFDGTLQQLMFTLGDFAEEIGAVIVRNPVVIASIRAVTEVVGLMTDYFIKSAPAIQAFIGDALKLAFNALPFLVDGFEIVGKSVLFLREIVLKAALGWTSFISVMLEFQLVERAITTSIEIIKTEFTVLLAAVSGLIEGFAALTGTEKFLTPVVEGIDNLGVGLATIKSEDVFSSIKTGVDSFGTSLSKSLGESDALFNSLTEGTKNARSFTEGLAKSIGSVSSQTREANAELDKLNALAAGGKDSPLTIGVAFDGIKEFFASTLNPTNITNAFQGVISAFNPESLKGAFTSIQNVFSVDNIKNSFKGAIDSIRNIKFEDVGSALQKAGSFISSGIQGAAQGFVGIFGGGFVNQFSGIISQIGNMPAALKAAFDNLDGIVNGLLDSLPGVIQSLLESIPKVAESFAKKFPEIVNMLVEAFPKITDALLAALPSVLQAILDAIPKIIDMIPKIVDKLAQAIPGLLRQIMQALPAIIQSLARAIPQIVRSLAAAIPEIVVVFAENIAPIILALVQGILEAIPEIILALVDVFIVKGGLVKIIFAIIQMIPQIAIALVQGIVRAAFNSTGALGSFLGKAFSSAIKFPKFDLGQAKDFLTGKLFADKVKENWNTIKDVLTGKKFADKVKELFDKFQEQLKKILSGGLAGGGGGGSGKGPVTGIKGSPLATGGLIPKGFNNDTFPARLTSGEFVIPPGPTADLVTFLKAQKQQSRDQVTLRQSSQQAAPNQQISIVLQVGQEQLAKTMLNLNRQGFRTA